MKELMTLQATEFFCGIGGFAACVPRSANLVAIDINRDALQIYRANFQHRVLCKTIESLTVEQLLRCPTDLWWMSPPCQPYTQRGRQRDCHDPRAAGFSRLVELLPKVQPESLALENVPAFGKSRSCEQLLTALQYHDYRVQSITLCPSQMGGTNRRRRFYLIASRSELVPWREIPVQTCDRLRLDDPADVARLQVRPEILNKFRAHLHVMDAAQPAGQASPTKCFTSAYGRSPIAAGSYVRQGDMIRHFSPREVLRQLDFPKSFTIPDWPDRKLWPLVANSLSLRAVKYVVSHLPVAASRTIPCPTDVPSLELELDGRPS